ncbi:uncharacterized protein LOC109827545 [Asparagus officinalis]|uniref:uncharacterized protein LOC109827545 n=1 Tax=Asparagus officinalis TaxID=4686 RepID=UPI00098E53FA|nr:uncharacterized protein LOC109827545 [Asparagus officinalis]
MPIHLRARAAYGTFREQYRGDERNRDKITANLELVEGFETASKEAASVYISQEEEQTEPDPHMLSAEDNITLTQHLMGHNRRGRYPLHGVGASPGISIRSSTHTIYIDESSHKQFPGYAICRTYLCVSD